MSSEDEMRRAFKEWFVVHSAKRNLDIYDESLARAAWNAACKWQRERDDEVIKRLREVQNSLNTWDSSRSEDANP